MGMFDYIRCEAPLPDDAMPANSTFQSKDLDCNLDTYVITASGRLMVKPWRKDAGESATIRDAAHHGYLNFYVYTEDKRRIEYRAKFTDGQLVEIKRVPT